VQSIKFFYAYEQSDIMSSLELLALSPPGWGAVLLRGLAMSVTVALGGYLVGLLIGIGGAFGKLYGGPVLRDLLACYTTIVRAIPELVLIVLLFYAGSDIVNRVEMFFGHPPMDINGLAAGIMVIGVVQGAYSTEVIRGAMRRTLHRIPEIGFQEHRTAAFIAERLDALGYTVHRGMAKTGVVGTLRNGSAQRAIGLRDGPIMAAVDEARISVHGCGGHGAAPEDTADPIVAGARIVMALQTIVARNIKPFEPAVVTEVSPAGLD
jgi:polar amino acid transport system permease protein